MQLIYDFIIFLIRLAYRLAGLFHPKARLFNQGRRDQKSYLDSNFPLASNDRLIWFHCASLGEFEQGRPVLEGLRNQFPSTKILLTFFSPSGYEVRKNYEHADFIFYLPWDTAANAKWFIKKIRPSLAIFVKYEFWHHYASELRKNNIALLSISAIFRPNQIYFESYGAFLRSILKNFDHFFVQNQASADLLNGIGVSAVTVAGDTRFDRVHQITVHSEEIQIAATFSAGSKVMVVGSAWPEDMETLYPLINRPGNQLKFIIAPHEINESFLLQISQAVQKKLILYSAAKLSTVADADILLVDSIGILSRLYQYGTFAFVGGGFKQGLHNILEAACFGLPVFFGNKAYQKFDEAVQLINLGGAFAVSDHTDLESKFRRLSDEPAAYQHAFNVTKQFVARNLGATEKILKYCAKILQA